MIRLIALRSKLEYLRRHMGRSPRIVPPFNRLGPSPPATKYPLAILSWIRQPSGLENKERFIFFESCRPFYSEFSHFICVGSIHLNN